MSCQFLRRPIPSEAVQMGREPLFEFALASRHTGKRQVPALKRADTYDADIFDVIFLTELDAARAH